MDEGRKEGNFDVTDKIVAFKRSMAGRRAELKRAFGEVKDHMSRASSRRQTLLKSPKFSSRGEKAARDLSRRRTSAGSRRSGLSTL